MATIRERVGHGQTKLRLAAAVWRGVDKASRIGEARTLLRVPAGRSGAPSLFPL